MKISTIIPVIREMHTSYLALITSGREIIAGALNGCVALCLCYRGCDERDNQTSTPKSTKYAIFSEYLFSNYLAAIIRENFDEQPWNENGEHFAIYSTTRRIGT